MNNSDFLTTLLWIGAVCGSLITIQLLASILFGIDNDADIDDDSFGIIKSLLSFFSIGSFTVRAILLNSQYDTSVAIFWGILSGILAVFILSLLFNFLLKNEEIGNWSLSDALHKEGEVYLPIPENGIGKISIKIKGAIREIEAKSADGYLSTGDKVLVLEVLEKEVIVTKR